MAPQSSRPGLLAALTSARSDGVSKPWRIGYRLGDFVAAEYARTVRPRAERMIGFSSSGTPGLLLWTAGPPPAMDQSWGWVMLSNFYKGVLLLRMKASDCSDSHSCGIHSRVHVPCVFSLTSLLLWAPRCISDMNHGHCELHSVHESYHGPGVATLPGRFPAMRGCRSVEHVADRTVYMRFRE